MCIRGNRVLHTAGNVALGFGRVGGIGKIIFIYASQACAVNGTVARQMAFSFYG